MIIDIISQSTFLSDYDTSNSNYHFIHSIRKFFIYIAENINISSERLYNHNRLEYNDSGNYFEQIYVQIDCDRITDLTCNSNLTLCLDLESFVRINRKKIYLQNEPKRISEISNPEQVRFGYIYYSYITLLRRGIDVFRKNIFLNSINDINNMTIYLIMQLHDENNQDKYYIMSIINNSLINSILNNNSYAFNILLPFIATITDNYYTEYISY